MNRNSGQKLSRRRVTSHFLGVPERVPGAQLVQLGAEMDGPLKRNGNVTPSTSTRDTGDGNNRQSVGGHNEIYLSVWTGS